MKRFTWEEYEFEVKISSYFQEEINARNDEGDDGTRIGSFDHP